MAADWAASWAGDDRQSHARAAAAIHGSVFMFDRFLIAWQGLVRNCDEGAGALPRMGAEGCRRHPGMARRWREELQAGWVPVAGA